MWSACSWDQRVRPRRRRRALRQVPYSGVLFAASCRSYRPHAHMEMALDRLSDAATFDHRPHHARAPATDRNGPVAVNRGDEFAARKRSVKAVSSSVLARAADIAESARLSVDLVVASAPGGARRDDRQSRDTRCDGGQTWRCTCRPRLPAWRGRAGAHCRGDTAPREDYDAAP